MKTRKSHIILGGAAGVGGSLAWSFVKEEEIRGLDWVGILVGSLIGGMLPDIIDPPLNPNHRAFGHSVVGNGSLAFVLLKTNDNHNIHPTLKWFLRSFVFAQWSHVISDLTTPKRIPFI